MVFGIWAANAWTVRENYLLPLSRLHSPLLKNHVWWKKNKFVQKIVTSTFLEFVKVFRFLATKLRQASQNFIVHVRRTFWGETTLLGKRSNFSSFPEFEQTVFRSLTGIIGQGGHNRILLAQMKIFYFLEERNEGKITSFWKLRIAIIFRLWAKRSLVLLHAWLRQACQKIVVHVQTNFFTNKFFGKLINFSSFPGIRQKLFRVLTRKFRQGGHNYFCTCT